MAKAKSKPEPKIRIVCGRCGSNDVRRDAFASWDIEAQDWVLAAVYDQGHCEHCQGEARLEEDVIDQTAPELPEIEPPEKYETKTVGELENLVGELPAAPKWEPHIVVERDDDSTLWTWRDKRENGGNDHGPFKNKRSALADCLNFYKSAGFEP